MADWMTVPLLHYDYGKTVWPRVGLAHPTIAPYGAYSVGGALGQEKTVLIGVQNDGEWSRFAGQVLGRADLLERAEFRSNLLRVQNRELLDAELGSILATMTPDDLRDKLRAAQVAFASVNGVEELSVHPQLRRTTVPTAHGQAHIVAPPALIRDEPRELGQVPTIGQHTAAIRAEFSSI